MGSVRQVDHVEISRSASVPRGTSENFREFSAAADGRTLLKDYQSAAKRLDKRKRRHPVQRGQGVWNVAGAGSEQEDVAPRLDECLEIHEHSRFDPHGADSQQVVRFVQLRTGEKRFEAGRQNLSLDRKSVV